MKELERIFIEKRDAITKDLGTIYGSLVMVQSGLETLHKLLDNLGIAVEKLQPQLMQLSKEAKELYKENKDRLQ